MDGRAFIPNIERQIAPEPKEDTLTKEDGTGAVLIKVARYAMLLLLGLLPVFFTPGLFASLGFDKVLMTLVLVSITLVAASLLMLRHRQTKSIFPVSLGLFWGVVLSALVSGLLSGDTQDALRGSVMETHTVAFLAVLGAVMSSMLVMQGSKEMTVKALMVFTGGVGLVLLYSFVRIVFGADVLPFGSFIAVTGSPIGGFNDLALLAGLSVILSLITLVQLPLRPVLQYTIATLCVLALAVLAVVNFFNVWIIVGFFGLLIFVYLLSRDTLFRTSEREQVPHSRVLIGLTMLVCIVSALFIVAGDYAGNRINQLTGINYVEVRPSVSATLGIAGAVYRENVLLGVGPNRFADAWRMYKDRSINETVFFDTDFNAGNGYFPTLFIHLGVLGGLLMVASHLAFLYLGYRMLLRSGPTDSYWYYFGVLSFTATIFIWGMSYLYVPGTAILLIGAAFTGFTFVAAGALVPTLVRTVPLAINRRRGFFLMAAVILIITGCVGTLFSVGKQYVAQAQFTEARLTAESVPEFEQGALESFNLYPDDRFLSALAQIQLVNLNALLNIPEPSEEEQQRFLTAAEQGLVFAERAVAVDYTNPDNHAILASIYSNLAVAGIDGAQARAEAALAEAQRLDPLNPGYRLLAAQMAVRIGDVELARNEIAAALNLKRNYTEALYLSAQLDIAEGNVEAAVATTRAMITLEPNNATRYFQLGLLLASSDQVRESIAAYQAAISIDPQYANARYLLGLAYLNLGETEAALEQLRVVQQTNLENESLNTLIARIESGETFEAPDLGFEAPVNEVAPTVGSEDDVVTGSDVDTDLVTPVNRVGGPDDTAEVELPVLPADSEEPTAE